MSSRFSTLVSNPPNGQSPHTPPVRADGGEVLAAMRGAAMRFNQMVSDWTKQRTLRNADAYLIAVAKNNPALMADIEAAQGRAEADSRLMDQALGRAWLARHPVGTFNATYQGRHNNFRTTPLVGLPAHLQYLPD